MFALILVPFSMCIKLEADGITGIEVQDASFALPLCAAVMFGLADSTVNVYGYCLVADIFTDAQDSNPHTLTPSHSHPNPRLTLPPA